MFQERVAEKDKKVKEATRLASIQLQKEFNENENAWWNRLADVDLPEFKLMPMGYIKKYYSYVTNLERYRGDFQLNENRNINDYYDQIKHLKTLLTEEQKKHLLAEFERAYIPDIVTMKDLEREEGDYMRRQPRIDPNKLSYNFEQYKRYTAQIRKAKSIDDEKSRRFYQIVKYVKANKDNTGDNIVKDFTER